MTLNSLSESRYNPERSDMTKSRLYDMDILAYLHQWGENTG
jgi:hypothetical protein